MKIKSILLASAALSLIVAGSSFATNATDYSGIGIVSGVTSGVSEAGSGASFGEDFGAASSVSFATATANAVGQNHANTAVSGTVNTAPTFTYAAQFDSAPAKELSIGASATSGTMFVTASAHGHDNSYWGPDQADAALTVGATVAQGSGAYSDSKDSFASANQGQNITVAVAKSASDNGSSFWGFDKTADVNISLSADYVAAGGSVAYANDTANRSYVASATGSVFDLNRSGGTNTTTMTGAGEVVGVAVVGNSFAEYQNSYTFDGGVTSGAVGYTAGSALVEKVGNATSASSTSFSVVNQ